jgi:DNA polymerase III sliding clamp (beta) subunit (PCNA family)
VKVVVLEQEADTLVVLAPRNEVGSATDRIPAGFAGTPADAGANAALLIRGLSTLAAGIDEVVIHLRGPTAPMILEPAGDTADRQVLAPVRLAEPIAGRV